MPDADDLRKWLDTIEPIFDDEPRPDEMGFCRVCDVDIYLPRQPLGLCQTCGSAREDAE